MSRTTPTDRTVTAADLQPDPEAVRMALDEQIDAYLDGVMSTAEARALERRFAEVAVADALAEAIAFRDLLTSEIGDDAPAGLADRIIDALGFGEEPAREAVTARTGATASTRGKRRRDRVRDAARLAGGILQGARILASTRGTKRGAEPEPGTAWAGLGTMRYALGPLAVVGGGASGSEVARPALRRRSDAQGKSK